MPRETAAKTEHQTTVARAKLDDLLRRSYGMPTHAPGHNARVEHYRIEQPKVAPRPLSSRIIGRQNVE